MLICNVRDFYPEYSFDIMGASYAGAPKDNTVMFISMKVIKLIENLNGHHDCLVFVPKTASVPKEVENKNGIIYCDNPQLEFARFATKLDSKIQNKNKYRRYHEKNGSVIGENVNIGEETYIEPGCFIDHDVTIGANSKILSGCRIRNAIIGDNFICNENAVIGNASFTIAEDDNGYKVRIPALGNVIVGNDVEVGPLNDIARGTCGSTILEDRVKLDGLVHIGHEAHLCEDVEITAGVTIAGFVHIGKKGYLGIGSSVKNRISIGKNSIIGMGAVVIRTVDENTVVVGNPARMIRKNEAEIGGGTRQISKL